MDTKEAMAGLASAVEESERALRGGRELRDRLDRAGPAFLIGVAEREHESLDHRRPERGRRAAQCGVRSIPSIYGSVVEG
jgi:hypothetical protein